MKTLAITGSRTYPDPETVYKVVSAYLGIGYSAVVTGGAQGVDTWAEDAARATGATVLPSIRPNYQAFKGMEHLAPLARNGEIVARGDIVLAFWDERSKGTLDAMRKAAALGKPLKVWGASGLQIEVRL